ncbi:MAG TPA: hypothetical protein DCQ26_02380 [Marinilabiliales bacterium]|nr:MAG: hypothetical protein A2W95_15895 [Bacteroidetes bacterium GWA2_40_14]OFX71963.1 MAG: hypothetical protein A2W96_03310 [Bacteroidetes bacterium GWD2_40_43]OFX89474.1 MAG: hypothetical protein A2W97_14060 [Bacteroidetes bacterium GWE2_40_63]OFY23299.1 MAG: hypothetical protein A2W88_19720 [Bacteroidetes bacterium GWF2_40_13]OFZ28090.1 MAG: hypothetical protein A2437_04270 [Bacteroidetes bacterium RIFOXYC2_FULL_40_12]HAM97434.1 hypothetical protein [Marinilabiliales bacterium]
MRNKFIILNLFLGIGLLVMAETPPYSLDPDKKLNQFNFDRWTTEYGLPTNSLLHIFQSSEGYIWLSGYSGIIKFDGQRFTVYNKKTTRNFESNVTGRISEDNMGTLWFTTQENGLISYKNEEFKSHGTSEGFVHLYRAIYIDDRNAIYGASSDKGWFIYKEGKFTTLSFSMPLNNIEVRTIVEGCDGEIYFGTLGEGLFIYKNGELKQFGPSDGLKSTWIYSLYFTNEKTLLLGTSNGLYEYDCKKFTPVITQNISTINAITQDSYGSTWLGTNNGIIRLKKGKQVSELIKDSQGLPPSFINDLIFDDEGDLWLTNYKGGLTRIKDGKFTNHNQNSGLSGKAVNAICEIKFGSYLAAYDNGDIDLITKDGVALFATQHKLLGKRIRHILKDSKENLWISTYDGLLKKTASGKEVFYHTDNGFPASKIRLAFEDSKGNIWIGTRNNGLIKIKPDGSLTLIDAKNGLNSMLIMSIDEMHEGTILVGTNDGGLNYIKNDSVYKILNKNRGLPSDIVFNVHEDSDQNFWIAMNGGLSYIKNDVIFNINSKNGLPDDSPFDVLEDESGNLWLPCVSGIIKINKASLLNFISGKNPTFESYLYNQNDGMAQEECNATSQSLKASDGSLLFPTIDGIAQINPMHLQVNTLKPNVLIESLFVNNKPANLHKPIIIHPGKNRLTFEFTALSLHEPQKNRFKYQLVGYEEEWTESGNNRSVSYTNLPPGYYTFRVIASNNDGIWNEKGDAVSFNIKPKFIQTNLFYVLLFLGGFIFVYGIYLYRIRQFKYRERVLELTVQKRTSEISQKNRELEEQKQEIESQAEKLAEQKAELEKINADKDKMFSIIAHDLRSPMGNFKSMLESLTAAPEFYDEQKRQRILLALTETAKNTFDLLENLLNWSRTKMNLMTYEPTIFVINDVINEILKLSKPIANKKSITILIKTEPNTTVYADVNMVKTVFRNLLMNAIKFTNEFGTVEIFSQYKEEYIEFAIKDSGVGIYPELLKNLFNNQIIQSSVGTHNEKGSGLGLMLCKEFVEKNGGTIHVESVPSVGSIFYFTLKTIPD